MRTVATVTVRAQDSGGTANGGRDTSAACTFTITVSGVCDAITANNDTAETLGSAPVTIAVLSNDSDIEGGLSIASVTQGANGAVAISGNNVIYTANGGFSGSHNHHKECEDLSVHLAQLMREGHEAQIHCIQHQLNRHENRNDVAAEQKARHSQRE